MMATSKRKLTAEEIARVAYDVNVGYCKGAGLDEPLPFELVAKGMVGAVLEHLVNPADPQLSHERWCASKQRDGWTYGPTKDAAAKTHPCLVPYAELPVSDRVKDYLFIAVVDACQMITTPGEES